MPCKWSFDSASAYCGQEGLWFFSRETRSKDVLYDVSVLYCAHLCMTCSLGISNFLEELSSLSHSVVFLYFFALITEKGFLIFACYSLELCIQMGITFLFCPSSQSSGFSSSHVWMWEVDFKESWAPKNWCFWTVVLEKTLESPLDCKEIQPVHPEGYQSWIFIGRTDVKAQTPIFWPPDVKSWLIWKDPDAGKDWRWEEKVTTEDEMVGWHHRLNGLELE